MAAEEKNSPHPLPLPAPSGGRNLMVNYLSMLSGTVLSKIMGLLTVLMLTRYLGVEDFGRYSLMFSLWALLNTLVDLGGSHIIGRDMAKDPAQPRKPMETLIYLRLLGCLLFLPPAFLLARWLGLDDHLTLIVFLGLLVGFEAFYDIYFTASMQLDKSAKARYFASLYHVILIAVAILLRLPFPVIMLIAMLNPLIKLVFDYRYVPFKPVLHLPDMDRIRQLVKNSWPLWLAGLQFIIMARADTLMLQVLVPNGEYHLGLYSAAFRFSEVMALLVNTLCTAMMPLLVVHMHNPSHINFLAGTSTRLILTVLMAMSLLIFWYAPWIVWIYGPDFSEAAPPMKVLIWSQALVAINAVIYHLLLVYNAQGRRPVVLTGFLVTGLNIGLNFLLIPLWQAVGAAVATVITELVMVVASLWYLRIYTPLRLGKDILMMEGLAGLACLPVVLMGGQYGWVSAALFLGLVFVLRLLTVAQIKTLASEKRHEALVNPSSVDRPAPDSR